MMWIPEHLQKTMPHTLPSEHGSVAGYKFRANQGDVGGVGKVLYQKNLKIELCGAGNEVRSFQLALRPQKSGELHFKPCKLKTRGGAVFSAANISIRRIGYVVLDGNMTPDPLLEEPRITVDAGATSAFWVTCRIPKHQQPGIYKGVLRVEGGGEKIDVSLVLTVFDFTLPETPSMGVNFWTFPVRYAKHFKTELWSEKYWKIIKPYAEDLKAHGQSIISLLDINSTGAAPLVKWQTNKNKKLTFDFTALDRWIQIHKNAGIEQGLELTGLANKKFRIFDQTKKKWLNIECAVGSEKHKRYWSEMLTALAAHLRSRGWMRNVMVKPSDEISEEYVPQWQMMAEFVKNCDRDFLTTEALGHGRSRLLGYCDVFAMHAWCGMDFVQEIRNAGAQPWWYFSCDCDNPNFFLKNDWIESRAIPWLTWRYGLRGVLRWSYSVWDADPFKDVYCALPYPAGDCYMVYPGAHGPVASVRWETFFEGVQDYEYLKMFYEQAQRLPIKEYQKVIKEAERYTQRVTGLVTYSRNYANYHAAHKFLGEKLSQFARKRDRRT